MHYFLIRENITPRGDGNEDASLTTIRTTFFIIRENITPRGDGNNLNDMITSYKTAKIRENITPRGDGNIDTINS